MKRRGFTLVEIIIAFGIFTVLAVLLTRFLIRGSSLFGTATWKIQTQQQMVKSMTILKEDLSKATYPSRITATEGVHLGALQSGNMDDDPGGFECISYLGNGQALEHDGTADYDTGISVISCLADKTNVEKPELANRSLKKFYGGGSGSTGAGSVAKYTNDYYIGDQVGDGDVILQFAICSPCSTSVGGSKGTAQFCRVLYKNRFYDENRKDLHWALFYQKTKPLTYNNDGIESGSASFEAANLEYNRYLVEDILRIDITHTLLPNDPPLGDYAPGGGPLAGLQLCRLNPNSPKYSIKQNTAAPSSRRYLLDSEASVDLRRHSLLLMMIIARQHKNLDKTAFTIAEPIAVKASVFVVDKIIE